MSAGKENKIFTAADIEKYHKGLLSPAEMHQLEKAALEDPFLADALEGYGSVPTNVGTDLSQLQNNLQERIGGSQVVAMRSARGSFSWWKVAAAVIILGGIGFVTFKLSSDKKDNSVAEVKDKLKETNPKEPAATVMPDSNISAGIIDTQTQKKPAEIVAARTSPRRFSDKISNDTNASAGLVASNALSVENAKKVKSDSQHERQNAPGDVAPGVANAKKAEPSVAPAEGVLSARKAAANVQPPMNYFNGRVVDASNHPLPFANITNVRDDVGTYADARGYFTLISPDSVLNVRVRSVGFETSVARLKGEAGNQVVLQEDKSAPDKILGFQKTDSSRSSARTMKLEQPEPLDGWINYNTYMANNVNVPDDLKMKHDNGQVQVSFDVNQNGEPVNIKVEKSLCTKCDEEAIRLIEQGPKWKKKNKKAKRVIVSVPFHTR